MPTNQKMSLKQEYRSGIGFMQGRLSPIVNGKIQRFPWESWREEFAAAADLGFEIMEWTLDQEFLLKNPLMTGQGRQEINLLSKTHKIDINSLTGDCFMQAPFWKLYGREMYARKKDFFSIINACSQIGIRYVVIPLVDGGRLENNDQSKALLEFLHNNDLAIGNSGIQIIYESDFGPDKLKAFIEQFDCKTFGINYDIGNSAALGFDVEKEFYAYGRRILNVHVKDRIFNGTTVQLGLGNADFVKVFRQLKKIGYRGNYILQTARADDGDHAGILGKYKSMVEEWLTKNGS